MSGPTGSSSRDPPQAANLNLEDDPADENTPLLARENSTENVHQHSAAQDVDASSDVSDDPKKKQKRRCPPARWPSFAALAVLCIGIVVILVLGFIAPQVVKEYAIQAQSYVSRGITLEEYTESGVNIRINGDFQLNSDQVRKTSVRNLGRFFTSIARSVESKETRVDVSLPEYGEVVIGSALIPPMIFDIRNKHVNHMSILVKLEPGDKAGIKRVANDWIKGRLGQLRLVGRANVGLKTGAISFGAQLSQELLILHDELPSIPEYDIKNLDFEEILLPHQKKALKVSVAIDVANGLPIDLQIPSLGFEVLVANCAADDPYIKIAEAQTSQVNVTQFADIRVNAAALVHDLPKSLTSTCPGSDNSPLDKMLTSYIAGEKTEVYIRGSSSPTGDTPPWIAKFLHSLTIPIPVPGKKLGKLIKKFKLEDVHFSLPDPLADPDTPEAQPKISANVRALINLPEEMTFPINVDRVRAEALVYYKDRPFGDLDLNKWQAASSKKVTDSKNHTDLEVKSFIDNAPVIITDQKVFTEVLTNLITSGETVHLMVKAEVDVQVNTTLGAFVAKKIPASGDVPVKPLPNNNDTDIPSKFSPKFNDVRITETTEDSLSLSALVSFTNPTKYSATIPYLSVNLLVNDTVLGQAYVKGMEIKEGNNSNVAVNVYWNPAAQGGEDGVQTGANLISRYLSGYNTSVTVQTYEGSIPSQPDLGRALSAFKIDIPAPKLKAPGNGDDDGDDDGPPHFIKYATMHIFSSTSSFTLLSPFKHSTLYIPFLNATAFYKNDTLGHIEYDARNPLSPDYPKGNIAVPPGVSETPRLPTSWTLGSSAPDVIRKALGGELKLGTYADVLVRLERYSLMVWFEGSGVGVRIRI